MARFRDLAESIPLDATAAPDHLDAVRQRRAGMSAALVALEEGLRDGAGPDAAWRSRVAAAFDAVRDQVAHHVTTTEAPGGFLDELVAQAPRIANQVDQLRAEHGDMLAAVADLSDRLVSGPGDDGPAWYEAIRTDLAALLQSLSRHHQRGADLVYEAYDVDIGGPG